MGWKLVLFDFDGTVYDTVEGITKSLEFGLRKRGFEARAGDLRCFAGPPLQDKLAEVYGVDAEEAAQIIACFRERYSPVGIYESAPYPGIRELLRSLKEAGFLVGVATSKPQTMAEKLMERSGIRDCFDVVAGSSMGPSSDQKWQVIRRAMEQCGAKQEETVLVGDTKYDVLGAGKCGIPCIGVRWGYAAPGELEEAGALGIAETMEELARVLLDSRS